MKQINNGQSLVRLPILVDGNGCAVQGICPVELDRVEYSSNISASTTPTAYLPTRAIRFDGKTRVRLEFYCVSVDQNNTESRLTFQANGANLTGYASILFTSENLQIPFYTSRFFTPAVGQCYFGISVVTTSGTGTFLAGITFAPMYLRVSAA